MTRSAWGSCGLQRRFMGAVKNSQNSDFNFHKTVALGSKATVGAPGHALSRLKQCSSQNSKIKCIRQLSHFPSIGNETLEEKDEVGICRETCRLQALTLSGTPCWPFRPLSPLLQAIEPPFVLSRCLGCSNMAAWLTQQTPMFSLWCFDGLSSAIVWIWNPLPNIYMLCDVLGSSGTFRGETRWKGVELL